MHTYDISKKRMKKAQPRHNSARQTTDNVPRKIPRFFSGLERNENITFLFWSYLMTSKNTIPVLMVKIETITHKNVSL